MATCNTVLCGICNAQHITKNADSWCPECEEGLCSECLRHHSVSKFTKLHEVISVENYLKLPPVVSEIVHHCPEHDKRYQNYCTKHESLCCPMCISSSHSECVGLLAIEELIKSSKTSNMIDDMERSLKDFSINLEKVIKDRQDNLITISQRRKVYQEKIKEMRERINEHLEQLESKIMADLSVAESKVKSEIDQVLLEIKEKINAVEELRNTLTAVKTYASDLQTFLSSKTIQEKVEMVDKYMQSLREDNRLKYISLELRTDDNTENILSAVTSFGTVSIVEGKPFTLKSEKDKQAQLLTAIQPVDETTDVMNLILNKRIQIPKGTYDINVRGCCLVADRRLVLVDGKGNWNSNNRILIFTSEGKFDDEIPFSKFSCDVTRIDESHLAVTTGNNAEILIISINAEETVKKTYSTNGGCWGVTHRQGKLFYIKHDVGIQELNLNDGAQKTFKHDKTLTKTSCITSHNDSIYYTNNITNTVTCCKATGKVIWQFRDETVLMNILGIAIDDESNVYVSSVRNKSVLVISSNGKHARRILGKENGINNPSLLCFDKASNYLVAIDDNAQLCLYNLT